MEGCDCCCGGDGDDAGDDDERWDGAGGEDVDADVLLFGAVLTLTSVTLLAADTAEAAELLLVPLESTTIELPLAAEPEPGTGVLVSTTTAAAVVLDVGTGTVDAVGLLIGKTWREPG